MQRKPDFSLALQDFLNSISNRDIATYKKYITNDEEMYTIVQNGHAFKTTQELISMHEQWFNDTNWIWESTVIKTVVGEDLSFALIKYDYKISKDASPFSTWLTYVFRLEKNEWRVIHDHNTALDFKAFAKSAGIEN